MAKKKFLAVGNDLGTTFSCVGIYNNKGVEVLPNNEGNKTTPSVVYFDKKDGSTTVGMSAYTMAPENPQNLVYDAKRMFNQSYDSKIIQESIPHWSFKVKKTEGTNDNIAIIVNTEQGERTYKPIEISAEVLRYINEPVKEKFGKYPDKVCVTHPAHFDDEAKRRTKQAAELGIPRNDKDTPVKIILMSEPTAAAFYNAHCLAANNQIKEDQEFKYIIVDIGGGTFDVSCMDFTMSGGIPIGQVKAVDGEKKLGGVDFDNIIMEYAKTHFYKANPALKNDPLTGEKLAAAELRLRQAAVNAKITLSQAPKATVSVPCYHGVTNLLVHIYKTQFETLSDHLFTIVIEKVKGALLRREGLKVFYTNDSKLDWPTMSQTNSMSKADLEKRLQQSKKDLDSVIMVGGSCKVPKFKKVLKDFFGEELVTMPVDPDHSIALGAALSANAGNPDIEDPSTVPTVLEVTPVNLNLDTQGDVAVSIIKGGSNIPITATQTFSTAADNQTSVELVISQGDRPFTKDNKIIGRFTLNGIKPAPRGVPQIEVTFFIDNDGLLEVTACDKGTNTKENIKISNSNDISEAELKQFQDNQEQFREADQKRLDLVKMRNQFDTELYEASTHAEKASISDDDKVEIKKLIEEEQVWLTTVGNNCDKETLESRKKEFSTKLSELFSKYGGQASANPDVQEVN